MNKLLLFLAASVFFHVQVSGQLDKNASIIAMMDEAESYIRDIENSYSKISKLEVGVIQQFLETPVYLVGNKTYKVLLVGERNRVKSIELSINRSSEGQRIVVDKISEKTNLIKFDFVPPKTEYYYLQVSVTEYFSGFDYAGYFIIISFN